MDNEPKLIKIINGSKVERIRDRLDPSLLDDEIKNSDPYKYGYYLDDSGILYDIRVFNFILITILRNGCNINKVYRDKDTTYLEIKVPIKSFINRMVENGKLEELSCDKVARYIKKTLVEYSIEKYDEDISEALKIIFIISDYSWTLENYTKIMKGIRESENDPFLFTHHRANEN